jgi:hypothetical protein
MELEPFWTGRGSGVGEDKDISVTVFGHLTRGLRVIDYRQRCIGHSLVPSRCCVSYGVQCVSQGLIITQQSAERDIFLTRALYDNEQVEYAAWRRGLLRT